jgi:putative ABC transport system substrate-binding protein
MKRRKFITLLGGAAVAWPLAARAQQAVPVIGFLSGASPNEHAIRLKAFRQGLEETGYVEGQNVDIEYRWAEARTERLQSLATELLNRQVTIIVAAGGTASALAAKAATASVPIVFGIATDPVEIGLVASLNRPGGNITGVTSLNVEVGPKRLELLRELLPSVTTVGLLVNPATPALADPFSRELQAAASALGLRLHVLYASSDRDFDRVFASLAELRAGALVIGPDNFFTARSEQLAALLTAACGTFRRFAALQRRVSDWGEPDMQMVARGEHMGADDPTPDHKPRRNPHLPPIAAITERSARGRSIRVTPRWFFWRTKKPRANCANPHQQIQ